MVWQIWVTRWWLLTGEILGTYNLNGGFNAEEILNRNGIARRGGSLYRDINDYLQEPTPLKSALETNGSGSARTHAESQLIHI